MQEQNPNHVYVDMMVDVLRHKRSILKQLLQMTKKQESLLKEDDLDREVFNMLVDEKGLQIDELNDIDEGFDSLFRRVKSEIIPNREKYRDQIRQMQELIAEVSDLGVSVQALEQQNSERFKAYLVRERQKIHDFHVNRKSASTYYQNMSNTHRSHQSYFFNETK